MIYRHTLGLIESGLLKLGGLSLAIGVVLGPQVAYCEQPEPQIAVVVTSPSGGRSECPMDRRALESWPGGETSYDAVDSSGNVYFVAAFCVFKVDTYGAISRVAGGGRQADGFRDGASAIHIPLWQPNGLAVDPAGNLYIAEGCRIRKVAKNGIITNFAGTACGYSGDGGPATKAQFGGIFALAFDSAGDLYITDYMNHRVRRITSMGVVSTLAGNGSNRISGDGGPASAAGLEAPQGVAVDSHGNVYISDYVTVRKITKDGRIDTIAGEFASGELRLGDGGPSKRARFWGTSGVAVDSSDNIYIADVNRVRKINANGIMNTIAGTGVPGNSDDGVSAGMARIVPESVAVDTRGNLYVRELGNDRPGEFRDATGRVYTVGVSNKRIRKVDSNGTLSTVAEIQPLPR